MLGAVSIGLLSCDGGPQDELTILSGSENRSLQPLIEAFCDDRGWVCHMTYQGSVDIRLALQSGAEGFDAVWPAHTRWVEMGDRERRVKHLRSIMQSPVVFAVAQPRAEQLGLIDRDVTTTELVELVRQGELEFIMTSATQSNSGFSAYMAMLTALAGAPEVITAEMLENDALKTEVGTLLDGVTRTSGSSGWLKSLYLEGADSAAYWAMFNYEALIIEANQDLERRGLPTLYTIYPSDGVAVADSPLGFVARDDNADKEEFFLELQQHLLTDEVQRELLALGRRTGFGGQIEGADDDVFRADWGIDVESVLPAIRFPAPDVIEEALALYQETLRKPSLLAMCLDFSGSMEGTGETQLREAIRLLFDQTTAQQYMLQATPEDIFLVIPFSSSPWNVAVARGPDDAAKLTEMVNQLRAQGGTDMYACAWQAFQEMLALPEIETHNAALLLLTDGQSEGDAASFARYYSQLARDIPIHAITFGDADETQLEEVAELSRARVFDGRGDLAAAFRHARGYN